MTPELKQKWVAALRSGDYKQGKNQLRSRNNEFCCLGVLCEVKNYTYNRTAYSLDDNACVYTLSSLMLDDVGLSSADSVNLARMNDGHDLLEPSSFSEIADYIEKNL